MKTTPAAWIKMILHDGSNPIFAIWVGLSDRVPNVVGDKFRPRSEALDRAIVAIRLQQPDGVKASIEVRQCAKCGAWSNPMQGCVAGCDAPILEGATRPGWNTPIPPRVARWLHSMGYRFERDPMKVWEREALSFHPYYRAQALRNAQQQ